MPQTRLCHICQYLERLYRDDELTINERQKKDVEYSNILDCIRRGILSQETVSVLRERVIDVTISEKIAELQNLKMSPVACFQLGSSAMTSIKKC